MLRPTCPQCGRPATGAVFLPSLAAVQYVVAVCSEHDVMGDGQHFSMDAMAESPQGFLEAFDAQTVGVDEALRGWLVARGRGEAPVTMLTTAEAAAELRLSERTVQRAVADGRLKAFRGDGRKAHLRIHPDDLEAFRKAQSKPRKPRVAPKVQPSDLF